LPVSRLTGYDWFNGSEEELIARLNVGEVGYAIPATALVDETTEKIAMHSYRKKSKLPNSVHENHGIIRKPAMIRNAILPMTQARFPFGSGGSFDPDSGRTPMGPLILHRQSSQSGE
jgi:hypothetical protein